MGKLKIHPEHFKILGEAINIVVNDNPGAYEEYKSEGLSDKRYNWDLLRASMIVIHGKNTTPTVVTKYCLPLYNYLNDSHIDSALAAITGKTGR